MREQDWANLTANGRISWERKSSCTSDSDEEVERWKNRLREVTTLNCNMMVRSLRCVTTKERGMPTYDGLKTVDEFLSKFESAIPEQHQFDALKWALCATPAQWWGTHHGNFEDWCRYRRMMCLQFGSPQLRMRVGKLGQSNLHAHLH